MKINPTKPYVQIFNNFECDSWRDELIKNNPNCIFHTVEAENNNLSSQEDIDRMLLS